FSRMGGEFIPSLDEGALAMQFIRPVTISTEQSLELERMSHNIIRSFPEVKHVFSRLGAAEITVDPAGINHGDTFIILKNRDLWPVVRGHLRSREELAAAMYNELRASVPGQRVLVSQPIELRFNELLEGVRADIALKIFGSDMKTLESLGARAAAIIRKIPGAGDVETEMRGTSPILSVVPKMDVLNRLGIQKSSVLNAVKIAMGGEEAGYLYEGVRKFPIIVRLHDNVRENLRALRHIPIGVSPGFTVPLSSVADTVISDQYSSIIRDASQRRTAVMINIRGRDMEGFVREAREKVKKELNLPPGYYTEWGGNFKNLESAKQRLLLLVPLTLFLVFFMIYSAFGNAAQTFLVFLGIPFALAGGVLGLVIMGLPFSISAGVGFIALSGIAVLNGVVLISYYNRLREEGEQGTSLVKKGALLRLRPVMMTAMTDILGFLPMMLATGTGSGVQKPLASVVVGGVCTSTILTLVMLPLLYRTFESRMMRRGT
nr:efflux RND transporter permease subunit [Spirochaetota bacterium]